MSRFPYLFVNRLWATGWRKKLRPWKRTVLYHRLNAICNRWQANTPHLISNLINTNNVCRTSIMAKMLNCDVKWTSFLALLLYGGLLATISITSAMPECKLVLFFVLIKNWAMGKRRHWQHNEKLHDLYSPPNIIRVMKSRRRRWAGHVTGMGESSGVYGVLVR